MKTYSSLFLILFGLFVTLLHAQAPQAVTYQAVLRNASGQLVANQPITARVSIMQDRPDGNIVYEETHAVSTNANGLYSFCVGNGTPVKGRFATIDWGHGPYYVLTATDPDGGSNYSIVTSQQVLSVPYALFADSVAHCPTAYRDTVVIAHRDTVYSQMCYSSDTLWIYDTIFEFHHDTIYKETRYSYDTLWIYDTIFEFRHDTVHQETRYTYDTLWVYDTIFEMCSGCNSIDSLRHTYDSLIHILTHVLDSLRSPTPTPSPTPACPPVYVTDTRTACDQFTWIDHRIYTSSTSRPTYTITRGNGCDSIVTLNLTILHGIHNVETQTATNSYSWHGVNYTESGTYTYAYINNSGCASTDTLHLTIETITVGALPGIFSIASGRKVLFSQGNLQYQASTGTFRFADNQYDYFGNTRGNATPSREERASQSGWIDLFGWGTSGYHNPDDNYNCYYQPYMSANYGGPFNGYLYNTYGYGPSFDPNGSSLVPPGLVGGNDGYDWGIYNAIANGGNTPGQWRTLTSDEWDYLLNVRSTSLTLQGVSNARYCKVRIDGKRGLIIFPDNFQYPNIIYTPSIPNSSSESYPSTSMSLSEWQQLETAGALFLPAAGYAEGGVSAAGSDGYYWSSTAKSIEKAYCLRFNSSSVTPNRDERRYYGYAVRLVHDN